jgi:hypothetical protein
LDIIDFCDAAGEWGSIVPIPAKEAERMIELAEQRRIADVETGTADTENKRPVGDDGWYYEVCTCSISSRHKLTSQGAPSMSLDILAQSWCGRLEDDVVFKSP